MTDRMYSTYFRRVLTTFSCLNPFCHRATPSYQEPLEDQHSYYSRELFPIPIIFFLAWFHSPQQPREGHKNLWLPNHDPTTYAEKAQ